MLQSHIGLQIHIELIVGLPLHLFQLPEAGRGSERFVLINVNIPFNGNIFVSNLFLGNLNIFDDLFRYVLRNVLSKILNGIVVSDSDFLGDGFNLALLFVFHLFDFLWDTFDLGLILVFDDLLFEGHIFDTTLTLDDFLACVDCGSNNLSSSNNGLSTCNDSLSWLNSPRHLVGSSSIVEVLSVSGAIDRLSGGDWDCSILVCGGGDWDIGGSVVGSSGVVGSGGDVAVSSTDQLSGFSIDKLTVRHGI